MHDSGAGVSVEICCTRQEINTHSEVLINGVLGLLSYAHHYILLIQGEYFDPGLDAGYFEADEKGKLEDHQPRKKNPFVLQLVRGIRENITWRPSGTHRLVKKLCTQTISLYLRSKAFK